MDRRMFTENNQFFASSGDSDDAESTIALLWHGERYLLPLPPPDAPLSTLRKTIEERTGVLPEHQKLILNGAVMQKDLPLKVYGLVHPSLSDPHSSSSSPSSSDQPSSAFKSLLKSWGLGSSSGSKKRQLTITMIGSKGQSDTGIGAPHKQSRSNKQQQQQHGKNAAEEVPDEPRVVSQIDSLVSTTITKLQPDLDTLFPSTTSPSVPPPTATATTTSDQAPTATLTSSAAAPAPATSSIPPPPSIPASAAEAENTPPSTSLKQKKVYISEMLLQALLKLDSFEIDSKWVDARRARKEGIRTVQGWLDRVDALQN